MLAPMLLLRASPGTPTGGASSANKDYQTTAFYLSAQAYGMIVGMAWLYSGTCKRDRRWLKISIGTLVTLSTIKVVCELWRLILVFGVHLAEAQVYSLYWRRHLQDPVILVAGAIIVGVSVFTRATQCSEILAAVTNPRTRTLRLVIRVVLYFLAFVSLTVGLALFSYLHNFGSYLGLVRTYRQKIPVTLVLANLWSATNLTLSLIIIPILSIDLWNIHKQRAAVLALTSARPPGRKLALVSRIWFICLRNGCHMYAIHLTILSSNGIRAWTGILTSLAPQAYIIAVLAYSSTPRPQLAASTVATSAASWDPDATPEPSSFASSAWGSGCSCLCCSHAAPHSGPEIWGRMLEGWRSSIRRIRIGEREMNRAIDKVGRGRVDLVEEKPRSASAEKLEEDGERETSAVVSRTRPADEEESWIEKSDRLLSPQNSILLPTTPPQALRIAFTQNVSGLPAGESRPRTFRRATSIEDADDAEEDKSLR